MSEATTPARPLAVVSSRYVTLELAEAMTGRSAASMRAKIARGDWIEGREYKRAPDGRIEIDMRGYERWVEGATA